jgi:hypothetical protein
MENLHRGFDLQTPAKENLPAGRTGGILLNPESHAFIVGRGASANDLT